MNPNHYELAPLLVALGRAGIELAPHPTDPARLRHRPADLAPDLADGLRRHRGTVLGLLGGTHGPASTRMPPEPADDSDAAYTLAERLGVADGLDLATHPGSPAWLVAVGESINTVSCSRNHQSEDFR